MYAATLTLDYSQGDVFWSVPLPSVTLRPSEPEALARGDEIVVEARIRRHPVAIVSHTCDVTNENRGKRPLVQVVPLHQASPHDLDEIARYGGLESINLEESRSFAHVFHYAPHSSLGNVSRLARLGNIVPIDRRHLGPERKVAELTPAARNLLRAKLRGHFGRGDDEPLVPVFGADDSA